MLKFKFLKFFIYFQICFITIYLLINLLSINFLLICEEIEIKDNNIPQIPSLSNLEEFYISNKSPEENVSKNCFMECLGAVDIFFKDGDGTEPFYYKKFLGKIAIPDFEKYYDMILNDQRTLPEMISFLTYIINPNLQIKNFKHFQFLYKNFLIEYCSLYEAEWHPAGFRKELDHFKNSITVEEVSPISVKKNKERIVEIYNALKFFTIIRRENNGIPSEFLINYSQYGQKFLKPLYCEFLDESEKIKDYYTQFYPNYKEFDGNYLYKLKHIIKHINKIQWLLEKYQLILTFNNFFFITAYDDVLDFERSLLFEKKTNIASIYKELEIEKKLFQELIFIIYYPKAANGDIYFMKKLKDSQFYLNKNKNLSEATYLHLPIFDLRWERTFKRYIRFLIKAGIINGNDSSTLLYLDNIKIFCEILTRYDRRLKPDKIMDLTKFLENFLITKILEKEEKLIIEYLSKDTVLKIKTKKIYYH